MNILLAGGPGALMNRLIKKCKKEGHKVFLLTGKRFKEDGYERVYERYDFPYESASLGEIFDSAAPDVTIYLGAFDTDYRWKNEQTDAADFVSGTVNLLEGFAHRGKGRFVYLSSDAVFGGDHPVGFSEEEPKDPAGAYAVAVSQGEDLCESYADNKGLDVMALRLCGLYAVPENTDACTDRISALGLTAMREGFISVTPNRSFCLLAVDDAVQFVSEVAFAAEHSRFCYQISSGSAVTEKELAELIQRALVGSSEGKNLLIENGKKETEEGTEYRIVEKGGSGRGNFAVVPGNAAFQQEFGINRLLPLEEGIQRTVSYMLEHKEVFMQDVEEQASFSSRFKNGAGLFFKALVPFLENAVCFIPFFLLDRWAGDSAYFFSFDFLLLYVVLFACVYGQQQAVFAAIIAAAARFISQMLSGTPLEVLSDYGTYVWAAQLFIIGLAAGYLRDRVSLQKDEAEEEHSYMSEQLTDIEEINKVNVRVKDSLQMQIINEDNSLGKIYEITSALNKYSADEVLFYAAEVLEKIIGTPDVAIYRISGGDYARLFTATSKKAWKFGNSVRYKELGELSDAVGRKQVFINRELDPSLPMMASTIYEGDEPRFLLMIWTLSWEKMTLGESDLLAVTGYLI